MAWGVAWGSAGVTPQSLTPVELDDAVPLEAVDVLDVDREPLELEPPVVDELEAECVPELLSLEPAVVPEVELECVPEGVEDDAPDVATEFDRVVDDVLSVDSDPPPVSVDESPPPHATANDVNAKTGTTKRTLPSMALFPSSGCA